MSAFNLNVFGEDARVVQFEGEVVSLDEALEQAGVEDADSYKVTVNGTEATEDQVVKNDDTVVLIPEVAGG